MALTPPFVLQIFDIIPNIESTPTLIFGNIHDCIIDSIALCNTSDSQLFFDFKIIVERIIDDVPIVREGYYFKKKLLKENETLELELGSLKTPKAGDLFYINSDFSGNTFDVTISGRAFTEVPQP